MQIAAQNQETSASRPWKATGNNTTSVSTSFIQSIFRQLFRHVLHRPELMRESCMTICGLELNSAKKCHSEGMASCTTTTIYLCPFAFTLKLCTSQRPVQHTLPYQRPLFLHKAPNICSKLRPCSSTHTHYSSQVTISVEWQSRKLWCFHCCPCKGCVAPRQFGKPSMIVMTFCAMDCRSVTKVIKWNCPGAEKNTHNWDVPLQEWQ